MAFCPMSSAPRLFSTWAFLSFASACVSCAATSSTALFAWASDATADARSAPLVATVVWFAISVIGTDGSSTASCASASATWAFARSSATCRSRGSISASSSPVLTA